MYRKILKITSFVVIITFLAGQLSSSYGATNLGASLLSDTSVNPSRTNDGREEIVNKLKPGAIGKGEPLAYLVKGILPERIENDKKSVKRDVLPKIREAIGIAISFHLMNRSKISKEYNEKSEATLFRLISLKRSLNKQLYLFKAQIEGPVDYMVGFNYKEDEKKVNFVGLDIDLVERLYADNPRFLAQYIYHECIPEHLVVKSRSAFNSYNLTVDRKDHRTNYKKIQTAIFGKREVAILGKKIKSYVNTLIREKNKEYYEKNEFARNSRRNQRVALILLCMLAVPASLALFSDKNGEVGNDQQQSQRAIEKVNDTARAIALFSLYQLVDGTEKKQDKLEKIAKLSKDDIARAIALFMLSQSAGERVKNQDKLEAIVNTSKNDTARAIALFRLSQSAGEWEKTQGKLEEIVNTSKNDTARAIALFRLSQSAGEWEKTQGKLEEIVNTSTDETARAIALFRLSQPAGEWEKTQGKLEEIVNMSEDDTARVIALFRLSQSAGEGEKTQDKLEEIVNTSEDDTARAIALFGLSQFVDGWKKTQGKLEEMVYGFIGAGEPLLRAMRGQLPEKIYLSQDEDKIVNKILRAINVIEARYLQNKGLIPQEHSERAEQVMERLREFLEHVPERLYLFNAVIESPEDYLLGFNVGGTIGLDIDLVQGLSSEMLAQYIYHESFVEKTTVNEETGDIDRSDHRVVYKEIQSAVFGTEQVDKLGKVFRNFIDQTSQDEEKQDLVTTSVKFQDLSDLGITLRAELFKNNLIQLLSAHPEKTFAVAIDTDIGAEQQAQIVPIWTAIDQIGEMKDAQGNPLFPNLKKVRGSGSQGTLMRRIQKDLLDNPEITFSKSDLFLVGRQTNIDKNIFDSMKGISWITGIDDSKAAQEIYLPVFEAISLSFMAALNADILSIKDFYDSISNEPITVEKLREMIRTKLIYILPKMTQQTENIRELYERVRTIYLAV